MTTKTKLNLWQKLLEVKKKVPYLKKDTKGYNFNYANPEAVLGAINPLLNEQGILLKTEVTNVHFERQLIKTRNGEKYENLYNVSMRMIFINTDEPNETDVNEWHGAGINGEEQGFGSALTYGERYFLLKYFNIPTGKDDPDSFIERAKEKEKSKTQVQRNFTEEADKCNDLKALGNWWKSLSADDKKKATSVKNNRKEELSKKDVKKEMADDEKILDMINRAKTIEHFKAILSFTDKHHETIKDRGLLSESFNNKADSLELEIAMLPF